MIWENRPFGIQTPPNVPFPPNGPYQAYQVEGETVVEAIFGYSNTIVPQGGPGYGSAADRIVLLRWSDQVPDPVVRVGDWIADVTYERQQWAVYNPNTQQGRFMNPPAQGSPPIGYPNPTNNFEWDDMPAQRCYWYQIQKVTSAAPDFNVPAQFGGHRSMTVYVNQSLVCRTVLTPGSTGPVARLPERGPDRTQRHQRDPPDDYRPNQQRWGQCFEFRRRLRPLTGSKE